MRRALALLTLATAPALVGAQSVPAGEVRLDNGRTFPNFINAAECAGAPIRVTWTISGTFVQGSTYTLYSSNVVPKDNTCFTAPNTTDGVAAGQVGATFTATGQGGELTVSAADVASKAGKTCSGDESVFLCVQMKSGGTNTGFAASEITISTTRPPAPRITEIRSGNGALILDWEPGGATTSAPAETQEVAFEAVPVPTTAVTQDPRPVVTSDRATAQNDFRFDGLVNGVPYTVRAYAFSKADNVSVASGAVTGTPAQVKDFWQTYKDAGGQELGGCASGAAGPLGLALLAATLALVRRKK